MIKPDFSADRLLPSFSAVFPYLSISIIVVGYIIAFAINKFDLALKGLYYTAPVVVASIIIIKRPNLNFDFIKNNLVICDKCPILFSILTYILLYLLSILVLLIYNERVIIYFIFITLIFCVIIIQIFSFNFNNKILEYLLLAEIFLVFMNLVWGVTLKYPLYFGFTDILPHTAMVNSIIESGHVTNFMDLYQFFPLYHILAATGIIIAGTQVKTGFFIFLGLTYTITLMFAYLFFQIITKDIKVSLLCLLIFSFSKDVVFYGMYMVTRSMAFIFFIIIFYLLIRKRPLDFEFKSILLIFTLSLILTHQVTLVYVSLILIILLIIYRYIYSEKKNLYLKYVTLFIISSLAYWLYVAFGFVTTSFRAFKVSEATPAFAIITTQENVITFIQNHTVDMITIFSITMSFAVLLNIKKVDKDLVFISTLSVLFFPFYMTNLLYMFPQAMDRFLISRIPLLLAIFIVIPIVYGALILHKILCKDIKKASLFIVIICLIFIAYLSFSIISPGLVSDSNDFPSSSGENTPYLTVNELTAFSFVKSKMTEPTLYSDYQGSRYFYNYTSYILAPQDVGNIQSGYFILRYGELQSRFLTLGITKYTAGGNYGNKLNSTNEPIQNILNIIYKKNKIYDSSDVMIYSFGNKP